MRTPLSSLRRIVDPVDAPHLAPPAGRRAAAVLLLFDVRDEALPLLFIERTDHLRHHAGQIGFPGGVAEAEDASIVATALREAREEVGVPEQRVEIIGLLPPFLTATSDRWLTPVLGLQSTDIALQPDPFEVARLFHVSLRRIEAAPHTVRTLEHEGRTREVHFYDVDGTIVWGVTAAIVHELLGRIAAVEAEQPIQR